MDSLGVNCFSLFDTEIVKRYRLAFVFGLGMVIIATKVVFFMRVASWQHALKSKNFLLDTPVLLRSRPSSEHFLVFIMNSIEINKSFFLFHAKPIKPTRHIEVLYNAIRSLIATAV